MQRQTRKHLEDRTALAQALARTYGGDRDGWVRVEEYQQVLDAAAQHPSKGSSALSTVVGLPRSRIRRWVEADGKPDPAHAVERAEELGWFDGHDGTPISIEAAVMVAWIYAGGSITEDWFVPRFSVSDHLSETIVTDSVRALGLSLKPVDRDHEDRGDELEPQTDASILGRYLNVLGAPVGPKGPDRPRRLPRWVFDAPDGLQRAFARSYVLSRGALNPDRPARPISIREERPDRYHDDLRKLFRAVVGDHKAVRGSGNSIQLTPKGAATLAYPPRVGTGYRTSAWPPPSLCEVLGYDITAPQAFDLWGVRAFGYTRSAWAERRGVTPGAVAERVSEGEETVGELGPTDLLPTEPDRFAMQILLSLCRAGLPPTEALDYYFAGGPGKLEYREWADVRGVDWRTAANNVSNARARLDE